MIHKGMKIGNIELENGSYESRFVSIDNIIGEMQECPQKIDASTLTVKEFFFLALEYLIYNDSDVLSTSEAKIEYFS